MLSINRLLLSVASGLMVASTAVQSAQIVSLEVSEPVGGQWEVVAMYRVSGDQNGDETGLGLRIHYNSTQLVYDGVADALANTVDFTDGEGNNLSMQVLQPTNGLPQSDPGEGGGYDEDNGTDKFVVFGWVDLTAAWPGESVADGVQLLTAKFHNADGFTGVDPTLNASASSTSAANPTGVPAKFVSCVDVPGGEGCSDTAYLCGNADMSSGETIADTVDIFDAFWVASYAAELEPDHFDKQAADVTLPWGDEGANPDIFDAFVIAQYAAELAPTTNTCLPDPTK